MWASAADGAEPSVIVCASERLFAAIRSRSRPAAYRPVNMIASPPEDAGQRDGLTQRGRHATAAPWAPLVLRADRHHTRLSCGASPRRLVGDRHSTCRCLAGATPRSAISARSHPINGLRTASAGNREKSRSADHNSATPCERQIAAMRASRMAPPCALAANASGSRCCK